MVPRSWSRYLVLISAVAVVADLAAVLSIQVVYDWLWGPDPRRLGFGRNLALDGLFILVHLVVGTAMIRFGKRVWVRVKGERCKQARTSSCRTSDRRTKILCTPIYEANDPSVGQADDG